VGFLDYAKQKAEAIKKANDERVAREKAAFESRRKAMVELEAEVEKAAAKRYKKAYIREASKSAVENAKINARARYGISQNNRARPARVDPDQIMKEFGF
jgi:hypothetical protein